MIDIDPADENVVSNGLIAIAEEMGEILQRSAHSSVVRETRDCATVVSDANGHAVAQAEMNAIHVNSIESVFSWARDHVDFATLRPGDALITNHPYQNAQHLNDIFVLLPVFHDGRLVAFASSVCHHIDVGGAIAGANASATDYLQEGLVIPFMRVELERDLLGGIVEKMLAANIRMATVVAGDFRAQISSVIRGRMLLERLFERHGTALVHGCMTRMLDRCAEQMRSALAALPDGEYEACDLMDGRTVDAEPLPIKVKLILRDGGAQVDLSECPDPVGWPINSTRASTEAAIMTIFACLLPAGTPINAGMFRPIEVRTRPGSLLDPLPPAPVRGRMAPVSRVASALKRALASAGCTRVSAGGGDATNFVTWTLRTADGYRMYSEGVACGYGAADGYDGESGLCQVLVNVLNTPIEAIERDHGFVRILAYGYVPDSGGAGRYRGGLGVRRCYEVLEDGVLLSTTGDRHSGAPWGFGGGADGACASYTLIRDGVATRIPPSSTMPVRKGDRFVAEAAGGGGFGDPRQRDRASVLLDFIHGRISRCAAIETYGMAEGELPAAGADRYLPSIPN
ncbi:MAG: hydantoinase B/oxoprolinase family protein [Burkholderiaceae bacterium]